MKEWLSEAGNGSIRRLQFERLWKVAGGESAGLGSHSNIQAGSTSLAPPTLLALAAHQIFMSVRASLQMHPNHQTLSRADRWRLARVKSCCSGDGVTDM